MAAVFYRTFLSRTKCRSERVCRYRFNTTPIRPGTYQDSRSIHNNAQQIQEQSEDEMVRLQALFSSLNNTEKMKHQYLPKLWTTRNEIRDYVQEHIDHILFDCDGVLYRSPDVVPGARECIESLQRQGKQVFFVTNNASSSRSELRHKLIQMLRVDESLLKDAQMVGCAYAAACYLRQHLEKGTRVYVIGSPGLCDELRSAGFNVVTTPANEPHFMDRDDMMRYEFPKDIDAVVVGHDPTFSFRKLTIATVILQHNPDALFVATNRDAYDLVGTGALRIPGNGSLVQSLECASSRVAVNVGKPSRTLAALIESEHGLNLSRTMMIGDRLDTDIQFGNDSGMFTALVLTGVTSAYDIYQILMEERQDHFAAMPDAVFPFVGLLS